MKIVSWNVNGIKACKLKGFEQVVKKLSPDLFCCQEVRSKTQLNINGYEQYWNLCTTKKGYSGTVILSKEKALAVTTDIGDSDLNAEGRMICLEFQDYYVLNVYVPNAESGLERLDVRIRWDKCLKNFILTLDKPVIVCGDFNVALESIDIYPENQRNKINESKFDQDTRTGMKNLIQTCNLIDVYRAYYPTQTRTYTWWSNRLNKRWENRGWRLDYFLISRELIGEVKEVEHLTKIYGSDHCPIRMEIQFWKPKEKNLLNDENAAEMWSSTNWAIMERKLSNMQHRLATEASLRHWDKCAEWQSIIVNSMPAKLLAVRKVINNNSGSGIDNVKWNTDAEKMKAVLSLSAEDYHHRPFYNFKLRERGGKERIIKVATQYDKAMETLYSFALKPLAESTADKHSFGFREGRSIFDAHECVKEIFDGYDKPDWAIYGDVRHYYDEINHDWIMKNILMDKHVLKEFLTAGVLENGVMKETDSGISQGSSISPVIGNMTLDGLEQYINENLSKVHSDGKVVRFADDIIISAESKERAENILRILKEFLEIRGLKLSEEKSKIVNLKDGFDFLSYHFEKNNGQIKSRPSDDAVKTFESSLEKYILNNNGSIKSFIQGLNRKLYGWGYYQRISDAYETFRHMDVVVNALLLTKTKKMYPRREQEKIRKKFWIKTSAGYSFSDPDHRDYQVISLTEMAPIRQIPTSSEANPYLDKSYYDELEYKREINRVSGDKYKAIWRRQMGICFACEKRMLPDQELAIVKIRPDKGTNAENLAYVHKRCANIAVDSSAWYGGEGINTLGLLETYISEESAKDDPYYMLREFFRTCNKSPVTLTFKKIEEIIGDNLDWTAYFTDAFWYDTAPGEWKEKWDADIPKRAIKYNYDECCISDAWLSQGYIIQRLKRADHKIVFRKNVHGKSGVIIPKQLLEKKIPNNAKYEVETFLTSIVEKYKL